MRPTGCGFSVTGDGVPRREGPKRGNCSRRWYHSVGSGPFALTTKEVEMSWRWRLGELFGIVIYMHVTFLLLIGWFLGRRG